MVARSGRRVCGVCAFAGDAAVEYFVGDVPECCSGGGGGGDDDDDDDDNADLDLRAASAAVALWSTKWVYAEEVNLLLQNGSVVRWDNPINIASVNLAVMRLSQRQGRSWNSGPKSN